MRDVWLLVVAGLFVGGFTRNVIVGDLDLVNSLLQWGIGSAR